MTQELINTIKVHAWTESELKEILFICITAMIDNDFIKDDAKSKELELGETIQ